MSKTRKIAKRFDVNEYEAELLDIKAKQAGLKEGQLIRELISGYAPTEAPGKEFYKAVDEVRRIGVNINQIAAVANGTNVIDVNWLRNLAKELDAKMLEIKEIVLKAKPYHHSYYEKLIYEQKKARAEGRPEPKFGDDLFGDN